MAWITGNSYVRINVWETSNTASAVAITVRVETVGSQRLSFFRGTLTIGGTAYTFTSSGSGDRASDGAGDAEVVYCNGSAVQKTGLSFSYNGASTKTISISLSDCTFINDNATGNARFCSASISGSYTATRPVVTAMTTSASSVTLGNSITITTSGGSSGSMTFKIGSSTVETKTGIGNTTTTWTPALATYAPYITSGASATCTITWNGISKSVTVTVPNNSNTKPTVSVSVAPNSGSIYVKGKSKAVATVTASGKYSATITNYAITMNGVTYTSTPATSGFLTTAGSNTCSVTVTDSRGFTNTASATFTVTDYSSPSYTGANVYRSDSSGNASSNGAYITFACTPSITSLSNVNAKKMGLQYRTQGSSSWTLNEEVTLSSYTAAVSYKRGGSLSASTVYEARFYLKDSYETVYSQTFTIPTDAVMMDFNSAGTGGAIGMYTQAANRFDIAWLLQMHNAITSLPNSESVSNGGIFVVPPQTFSTSISDIQSVREILIYICSNYPNKNYCQFIGNYISGNIRKAYHIFISATSTLDTNGIPQWANGYMMKLGGGIFSIESYNYVVYMKNLMMLQTTNTVTPYSNNIIDYAGASGTTKTYTLVSGHSYLVTVSRRNTTSTNFDGMWICANHTTNSHLTAIRQPTSSYNISVSSNTLTIVTWENYMNISILDLGIA